MGEDGRGEYKGATGQNMTKPTDNPADPFKKALAEATKTLANDPDMTVTYSVDPAGMSKEGIRLPQVSRRMTRDEVLLARGTADAFALRLAQQLAASQEAPWAAMIKYQRLQR